VEPGIGVPVLSAGRCAGWGALKRRSPWLLALAFATPLGARSQTQTRADALQRVFGTDARLEQKNVFLTDAQVDAVETQARARLEHARVSVYQASRADTVVGRAYLDTHRVRSQHATLLVVVGPDGRTRNVEILAFHEPEDYRPPSRWLRTLVGRDLSQPLQPGADVDAISGATLSVRATTAAVRRVLAIDRVLYGDKP